MKQHLAVWGTLALLVAASAVAAHLVAPDTPAAAAGHVPADAGADTHAPPAHRRVDAPVEGETPTLLDATTHLDRRGDIVIRGDDAWTPAAGVRGGSGTPADPYRITGWFVDTVLIADTDACYEIAENYVSRILVLDWTGPCGLVHHNHLNDFRTNRNVARTGNATAAVVTENRILHVTELRHFDGALTDNVIGREEDPLRARVALNIQGLNGATITRNHVYGGVDMRLHGHHHGSHHDAVSHNHGDGAAPGGVDHGVRHISFRFTGNVIESDAFGLRYNDLDHAANDRQAASEQEPALEDPHHHFTEVRIAGNTIRGAGVRVAVFNAPDTRHLGSEGTLLVEGNVIDAPLAGHGVLVHDVRNATVIVRGNTVRETPLKLDGGAGVMLMRFANATVRVEENDLPGFRYGVRAQAFDAHTTWQVRGNAAPGARWDVYWDDSVAHPPETDGGDAEASGHDDHDHRDASAKGATGSVAGGARAGAAGRYSVPTP